MSSGGRGSPGGVFGGGSCAGRGVIHIADKIMSVSTNIDVKVRLYGFMSRLSGIVLLLVAILICLGAYNVYVVALLMNNISKIGYLKP